MNDFIAIRNNQGVPIIKMMDTVPVTEMMSLCDLIEKGLKEKEYNIENVEVICDRCIISLIISIRDNNETLYLGYRIDEQHDKDYFYLVPNGLSLPDDYYDELWDNFYEKMINDIFDILSE